MVEQTIAVQSGYAKHRLKTERRASITDTAGTRWLGSVRDISRGGIALILWRRFERGTKLRLDLASKAIELRGLSAQVVHAKWEMNGQWIIGCEFTSPLSQGELQGLLVEE